MENQVFIPFLRHEFCSSQSVYLKNADIINGTYTINRHVYGAIAWRLRLLS